jgi:hypothetical protein
LAPDLAQSKIEPATRRSDEQDFLLRSDRRKRYATSRIQSVNSHLGAYYHVLQERAISWSSQSTLSELEMKLLRRVTTDAMLDEPSRSSKPQVGL